MVVTWCFTPTQPVRLHKGEKDKAVVVTWCFTPSRPVRLHQGEKAKASRHSKKAHIYKSNGLLLTLEKCRTRASSVGPERQVSEPSVKCRNSVKSRWWSLCTLYLHACQVIVTVGNSGLCCCVSLRDVLREVTNSLVCCFERK